MLVKYALSTDFTFLLTTIAANLQTVPFLFQKLNMELPYKPTLLLPGTYPKELKAGV